MRYGKGMHPMARLNLCDCVAYALAKHLNVSLLFKGMIERRARRRSEARESLGRALGIFEHLGAPLWADKARRELSKITVRAQADGLTDTECRIAALITQGQANRQIATTMFITENTVQTHLRHIFRKLGVRSRTELATLFLSIQATAATAADPSAASQPH